MRAFQGHTCEETSCYSTRENLVSPKYSTEKGKNNNIKISNCSYKFLKYSRLYFISNVFNNISIFSVNFSLSFYCL